MEEQRARGIKTNVYLEIEGSDNCTYESVAIFKSIASAPNS